MREEIKNWWKQAEKDLNTARNNVKNKDYYAASFFAQQSVEKAFKALLIKKYNELPKVHDLVFLGKKLDISDELLDKCDKLSKVYIETRYPDLAGDLPYQKFNKEKTEEHIGIAAELLKWVEKRI